MLTARLAPLSGALLAEPNPVVIKGVLHARGLIASPAVRLPLLPASTAAVNAALALALPRIAPRLTAYCVAGGSGV